MIAANQWVPIMQIAKLANLDNYKGYVVGEGAGTPGVDAIQNRVLQILNWSLCRFEDQSLKAFHPEHLVKTVKDFDKPVGVENQAVTGCEFKIFSRFRPRSFRERTEDTSSRIEQAGRAFGNVDYWRMACGGKAHPASTVTEAGCGHCEVKTVLPDTIEHEFMKLVQQISWITGSIQFVKSLGVDAIGYEGRAYSVSGYIAHDNV